MNDICVVLTVPRTHPYYRRLIGQIDNNFLGGRSPVIQQRRIIIGERGSSWSGRARVQPAQRASDPSGRQRLALVRPACPPRKQLHIRALNSSHWLPRKQLHIATDFGIEPVDETSRETRISIASCYYSTERASKLSAGPTQRSDEFNIDREIQKSPHPPSLDFQWDVPPRGRTIR